MGHFGKIKRRVKKILQPRYLYCFGCGQSFVSNNTLCQDYCTHTCWIENQGMHIYGTPYKGLEEVWGLSKSEIMLWEEEHGEIWQKIRDKFHNPKCLDTMIKGKTVYVTLFDDGDIRWWCG